MISCSDILVVDDDPEDHFILAEYFKDVGKEKHVKFIENGHLAMTYLSGIADENLLPKLIVLDLNMPILNGTQTLLEIKRNERLKHIPVIIFSTSENENEKRKCLSLGALEYLVKPLTYDEGQKMVEKFAGYIH
jgi:CheY-like chemotaxis protein